jgi:hypothetical protein
MMSIPLRVLIPTLLALLMVCTEGPLAAQEDNKTAPISGKWKGTFIETNGNAGKSALELSVDDTGKVTGLWDNIQIENGLRVADTVTWNIKAGEAGNHDTSVCLVYGKILDGGKRLILEYSYIEKAEGRLHKVTATSTLQKE